MKESIQDSTNPEETNKVFIDIKIKIEEDKMIEETQKKTRRKGKDTCKNGKWNSITQRETIEKLNQVELWQ